MDLRLIGNEAAVTQARAIALEAFAAHLVSDDGASLEAVVLKQLREAHLTLATAESVQVDWWHRVSPMCRVRARCLPMAS